MLSTTYKTVSFNGDFLNWRSITSTTLNHVHYQSVTEHGK